MKMSIDNIQNSLPKALELFKTLGLLPGGIYESELDELLGDDEWTSSKLKLIEAFLIAYNHAEKKLSILPFMISKACQLLEAEPNKKNDLHLKCCNFYIKFLHSCMNKIMIGNFKLNEFVEREENIWACIYRGINRKKDIDDFDTDTEDNEMQTYTFKRSSSLCKPNKDTVKSLITDSVLNSYDVTRRHEVIEEELSFGDDESDSKEDIKDFSDHDSFSDSGSSSSHDDFNSSSNTPNNSKNLSAEALKIVKHTSDPK
jgi:hypothetical protein